MMEDKLQIIHQSTHKLMIPMVCRGINKALTNQATFIQVFCSLIALVIHTIMTPITFRI